MFNLYLKCMDLQIDEGKFFCFVFFWKSGPYFKCLFWRYSRFSSERNSRNTIFVSLKKLWGAERSLALWNYIDLNFKGTAPVEDSSETEFPKCDICKKVGEQKGPWLEICWLEFGECSSGSLPETVQYAPPSKDMLFSPIIRICGVVWDTGIFFGYGGRRVPVIKIGSVTCIRGNRE